MNHCYIQRNISRNGNIIYLPHPLPRCRENEISCKTNHNSKLNPLREIAFVSETLTLNPIYAFIRTYRYPVTSCKHACFAPVAPITGTHVAPSTNKVRGATPSRPLYGLVYAHARL